MQLEVTNGLHCVMHSDRWSSKLTPLKPTKHSAEPNIYRHLSTSQVYFSPVAGGQVRTQSEISIQHPFCFGWMEIMMVIAIQEVTRERQED